MSVTPNYNWPLIEPTDFVTNLPADFEAFGDAVDATVDGIETTANAALPETIIDAAGDLIYGSAADTAARLAIGTAGQVLKVNSGATAPEWDDAAGGGSSNYYVATGRNLYVQSPFADAVTNQDPTEDVTYYMPIYLPTCTIDRIGIRAGSSFSGSATVRLGIYGSTDNEPDNLILDAGTVSVTSASTNYQITISQSVTEGIYWLAINQQTAQNGQQVYVGGNNNFLLQARTAIGLSPLTPIQNGYRQTSVSGAFANAGTLIFEDGAMVNVNVRVN